MYSWPSDLPPSLFENLILESILFTRNTISMNLNDEVDIVIMSGGVLRLDNDINPFAVPPAETRLVSLVGSAVKKAEVGADGSLIRLQFSSRKDLIINGNDKQYECYTVSRAGREYVV